MRNLTIYEEMLTNSIKKGDLYSVIIDFNNAIEYGVNSSYLLMTAIENNRHNIIKYLLNMNIEVSHRMTQLAKNIGNQKTIKIINDNYNSNKNENIVDIKATDAGEMEKAIQNGDLYFVMSNYKNKEHDDKDNQAYLKYAILYQRASIVNLLLAANVRVDFEMIELASNTDNQKIIELINEHYSPETQFNKKNDLEQDQEALSF